MKLTISQEGMKPITIDTAPEKTIRSQEYKTPDVQVNTNVNDYINELKRISNNMEERRTSYQDEVPVEAPKYTDEEERALRNYTNPSDYHHWRYNNPTYDWDWAASNGPNAVTQLKNAADKDTDYTVKKLEAFERMPGGEPRRSTFHHSDFGTPGNLSVNIPPDWKTDMDDQVYAINKTFRETAYDPTKLKNELDSLNNEQYGRALSDSYRLQANRDIHKGASIAGMPSNLTAGTANGSYIPKTDESITYEGKVYEISPFTNKPILNNPPGPQSQYPEQPDTNNLAKLKAPEFMTDNELKYYLDSINNMAFKDEEYKTRLQAEYNKRNGIEPPKPTTKEKISDITSNVIKVATNPENLKKAGIGAAVLVGADILVRRIIGGTVFNAVTSIGKFNSGNEMLSSPKLKSKLSEIAKKYPGPYPTLERIKSDPKAKSRDTFIAWLLSGQSINKKISNQIGSTSMLLKKSEQGIPVAITSLSAANSQSGQQLSGLKILIANAFVNKNGQLASIPVARGFLAKGSMVNASREAADIYFDKDGLRFNKENIIDMANKTMESFGPISSIQSSIIDEYCI